MTEYAKAFNNSGAIKECPLTPEERVDLDIRLALSRASALNAVSHSLNQNAPRPFPTSPQISMADWVRAMGG